MRTPGRKPKVVGRRAILTIPGSTTQTEAPLSDPRYSPVMDPDTFGPGFVPGFRVGSAEDPEAATGCTVVLCPPEGATFGLTRLGCATGTRQVDSADLGHVVDRCHAILLTGGSAFGLDATGGARRTSPATEISSSGSRREAAASADLLGALAADLVADAIIRAVRAARTLHGIPAVHS